MIFEILSLNGDNYIQSKIESFSSEEFCKMIQKQVKAFVLSAANVDNCIRYTLHKDIASLDDKETVIPFSKDFLESFNF